MLEWVRWDIFLSWEGAYPTKIKTQKRWIFFAHNKNLIMGGGGSIAAPVHKLEIKFDH